MGHSYCIYCGRPADAPEGNVFTNILRVAGTVLVLACTAMLFFEIFTVFWGIGEIWPYLDYYRLGILVLTPSPAILFYVSGIFAKIYYLFIVAAVIASFVFLMYRSSGALREFVAGRTEGMKEMPLYSVVTLFAATISLNLICVAIVMFFDYTPAVPPAEELWKELYSLMNAAVWEEVICRIALIGLPVMILGIAKNEKGAWKGLLGGTGVNRSAIVLIFISSIIFSYGHLAGWDLFKMIPTFVTGLALGYLFVRYGVYASIMLHFLVNYMSSVSWVFDSLGADLMLTLFILSVVVLGLPFILWYAVQGFKRLREEFSK